jgi:hypothetical protein
MRAAAVTFLLIAGCLAVPPAAEKAIIPDDEPDALARAAACLDRGDDVAAVPHLTEHVRLHPDEVMTRAMLAELLFRLHRYPAARTEFERVVVDAQEMTGKPRDHLVHCHTRLMQVAEADGDEFAEQLNRGIAMLLLVKKWDTDEDRADDRATEAALGKAVKALRAAKAERPDDPRVNLYLVEVYERMRLAASARGSRSAVVFGSPFALTPGERNRLQAGR